MRVINSHLALLRRVQGDPKMLNAVQTAKKIGISPGTLWRWRTAGYGPEHIKVGRWVFYQRSQVNAWVRQRPNRKRFRFFEDALSEQQKNK